MNIIIEETQHAGESKHCKHTTQLLMIAKQ